MEVNEQLKNKKCVIITETEDGKHAINYQNINPADTIKMAFSLLDMGFGKFREGSPEIAPSYLQYVTDQFASYYCAWRGDIQKWAEENMKEKENE